MAVDTGAPTDPDAAWEPDPPMITARAAYLVDQVTSRRMTVDVLARMVAEAEARKLVAERDASELRVEVGRLSSVEFVHGGCEMLRRKDVEYLLGVWDALRTASSALLYAVTDAYVAPVADDEQGATRARLGLAHQNLERLLTDGDGR